VITTVIRKLYNFLAKDRHQNNRFAYNSLTNVENEFSPTEAPSDILTAPGSASPTGRVRNVLIASVGATAFILGITELKWLQSAELRAYDQMLQMRPPQAPDKRVLLVTITEEEIYSKKSLLTDNTINTLLDRLQSYQPRVIGLNIYVHQKNLGVDLEKHGNIINVCNFSSIGDSEIAPPPFVSMDNVGFSDIISDSDGIVRRSLLFAHSHEDTKCKTSYSFAALLAIDYLKKQGIKLDFTNQQVMKLDQILFPPLTPNSGSYKGIDAGGYQIMLNYRHPDKFPKTVTLTQVLNNQVDSSIIKDKLVIVGVTARSIHPGFYTPYSALPNQPARMPPAYIHAHMASQIIATVLDRRSPIWYLPEWAELLWVWSWALVGSTLAWRWRHPMLLAVVGSTTLATLVGICTLLFVQGGWIPVIPPALALVISGVSVMAYTSYQTQQQTELILLQVQKQQEAIEQLNILHKEDIAIKDKNIPVAPKIDIPNKATGDLLLSGRYKITNVLGAGGFGCTYLAQDTQRPGKPTCVVKQLMPARRDTKFLQVARRLFDAEAEILEVLGKHHQIPELLAYFEDDKEFYLVQEYIQGNSLSDELPPYRGIQSEAVVLDILKGILEVLAFVHQHRVIHRDIKPSNIIRRSQDNQLVLIDFGAVKLMQSPTSEQTELATVAIGTRGYAPPEQFAGHPRLCSDIYALGMIAIQALTGIPPHHFQPDPDTGTILWRQWVQVSDELAAILDKMVRYHFSERYQSATEVLQALRHIL
jgi:CHASE2 domain-containing sensor protein/predicted Ser/Thr protein kinase